MGKGHRLRLPGIRVRQPPLDGEDLSFLIPFASYLVMFYCTANCLSVDKKINEDL